MCTAQSFDNQFAVHETDHQSNVEHEGSSDNVKPLPLGSIGSNYRAMQRFFNTTISWLQVFGISLNTIFIDPEANTFWWAIPPAETMCHASKV